MQTHYKIQSETKINASLEKVWEALTNPVIVRKYFFGTELITDWKVGSDIYFQGEWEGQKYKDRGKVLEYIENKKLTYSTLSNWSGKEDKLENYLIVTYEVKPNENKTELIITQTNYDEEKARQSEKNWAMLIEEMKKTIE